MLSGKTVAGWARNRFVWVAVILLAASAGAMALAGGKSDPVDLQGQITTRLRTTLEQVDPGQHNHGGHAVTTADAPVICGVRVYGYEPAEVSAFTDVRTVYGFHLCGVAEPGAPWDVAVKLAGPLIMDMSTDPPGIRVVEATADVMFVDRLREMFPAKYAELALKEALVESEMNDLRTRYDAAAGL
ncbi:hypothetical protein [Asanoa sp. NPDC050611]|uniref:hypothetical protein n=1 Tax=Asanoa sp. NPDC050611 TaxID=3157098 RepID=UPI0033F70FF2